MNRITTRWHESRIPYEGPVRAGGGDVVLAGREPANAGVFGVPDPGLDARVGAVAGLEERP